MVAVAFSSAVDSGAPFKDSHGKEASLNEVEYYCSPCLVLAPPLSVLAIGGEIRRDDCWIFVL